MQLILSLFLAVNTHFIVISSQLGLFFYILSAYVIKGDVSDWLAEIEYVCPSPIGVGVNMGFGDTVQDYYGLYSSSNKNHATHHQNGGTLPSRSIFYHTKSKQF